MDIIECSPQTRIHQFGIPGLTTFFCWDRVPLTLRADSFQKELQNVSVAVGEAVKITGLGVQWRKLMNILTDQWYADVIGRISLARTDSEQAGQTAEQGLSWSEEKELIQVFEQGRNTELQKALLCCREKLLQERAAIFLVKETATRLDRIFVRISGSIPEDPKLLENALSHTMLFNELLRRTHSYLEFLKSKQSNWTDHQGINRIIEHAHQYYPNILTLKSMAKLVAMEEHYLSRLFKQKTGETLINFIQKVRVEKAKLLLVETEMPIVEIGVNVGFPNDNYFGKIFKRWSDKTPGQYRKKHLED
jgi:two-component system response regulator YesN